MSVEKYFEPYNSVSIIFDPIPSYKGDWGFDIENLIKNSKKEQGINLFSDFYNITYCDPLKEIFKTERILDFNVGMISKANDNNIGRCLKYSKVDFFIEMSSFLNQNIDRFGKSNDEQQAYLINLISNIHKDNETLNLAYSEALSEKAKKLKNLLENEINSEYFDAAMKDYAFYKNKMDFTSYIKSAYKITTDFQNGMLRLGDFFDKNIDFVELSKNFDIDTFYLLFAKIIYEFNLMRENEDNILDNSYGYLYLYNNALNEENRKYDPKILYTLSSGKKMRYSRYQFQEDFKSLMERHPEAKAITLPKLENDNNDKYKDISLMEKLTQLYSEDTQVNWEFLPEGEGIKKSQKSTNSVNKEINKKDKEVLINETNLRIGILENSGFLGRPIKGLNTFAGYYAFIYPNGKVILEKFWENEETMNPAVGSATYVMNIDNFIEMSKISRLNLIEYIKTLPEVGVKRIFHTTINNWQRNLYDEINGTYRLEDAIEFINGLKSGAITNE